MNFRPVRLFLLITWEYLKRNVTLVIGSVLIIILLVIFQTKLKFFQSSDTIRVGLIGTYQEHDLPIEVTKLLSSGLIEASSDGKIKPNLVKGWETNNDATQFKFKLKDLSWADEETVKASDLEFTIPNTNVSFPDDKTIQFDLQESFSPLPSLLTGPVFKKGTLTGVGPYKIKSIEKSRIFITKLILESKDNKFPNIAIRFYPNEKIAVTGFNLGEVQVLMGLSNPKLISSNSLISMRQTTDYSKIVTILFQTTDPLLSNRSIRQSLAFKTPKIEGEEVANNPYPPQSWAYDSDSKKYLSNPEEALAALERAKASLPSDKFNSELILTATPNLEEVGKVVAESWKELGFDSKLRVESGIPQNFQTLLITQSIPVDPDQYFLWHATQTKTNLTKYNSKRVDKDLEDGRKIITEDERQANYFDFQKTLLEDAPAVFLYFPKYNIVYLKKVEPLLDKVLSP
ncbi:ABC transporter substrate-binding protein [Patescibacteria group bacterium]|nr:ABC transporter substrate-binding protein [Patescibacteria group bacterium]